MIQKRVLTSRAAHVEKTELWKEFPDYYRELEEYHLWPLWEEINKFTGAGMPTSASSSMVRASAAFLLMPLWTMMVSVNWRPMV